MKFYPDDENKIKHLKYASFKRAYSFGVKKMYFIGGRDYGKTYSTKHDIFKDFVKNGKLFAWVRTTDVALELIKDDSTFFARQTYLKSIGVHSHSIRKNRIYINGKIAGYFFSVNTAHNVKGGEYQIDNIVWDEFMKFGNERPLKNKRKLFFDLVESIGRGEASRIYFLSNSTNKYDDVISPFNINLSLGYGCYLYREENSVIHYMKPSDAYLERVSKNLAMSGMTTTERNMAVSNKFTDYGDYGSEKKLKVYCSIQTDDDKFINIYLGKEKMYVKKSSTPVDEKIFAINKSFINSTVKKLSTVLKNIIGLYYNNGKMVFEDGYCRDILQEII